MLHEPSAQAGKDNAADYKMRLGVKMFIFYTLFYVGFAAINVISPVLMEKPIVFGMNLACTYGFALIIVALIMALVYNHMCTKQEGILNTDESQEVDSHPSKEDK
ncbi:DUF485 domain-containing protein [bacterium]|nr:DUF485 domain-containing protein [bacterium]